MKDYPNIKNVFKKGSTTYYFSSLFFPKHKREEVSLLYSWVRIADDFVDSVPQQKMEFEEFCAEFEKAWAGNSSNPYQNDFVALARRYQFEKKWLDAFLKSMRMDTTQSSYTFTELQTYMYGSAQVIGLFMSRIMELDPKLDSYAKDLGRAMQLINFIRDIAEDKKIGRTYLSKPSYTYILLYKKWDARARKSFSQIPYRYRIPIMTAADMYIWTANAIERDPQIVYTRKVKPPKLFILYRGIKHAIIEKISS